LSPSLAPGQLLSPVVSQVIPKARVVATEPTEGETVDEGEGERLVDPVRWAVPLNESDVVVGVSEPATPTRYCLLVVANITVILLGDKQNISVAVPYDASVGGECEETLEEEDEEIEKMWLNWDSDNKQNMLNISISRNGRLALLSKIQTSLSVGTSRLTTRLHPYDYVVPSWPLRYGLHCGKMIQFPLYDMDDNKDNSESNGTTHRQLPAPVAFVQIEDLKIEAFRLDDEYGGSVAQYYSRYTWECEFHKRSDWAPIVVAVGLFALVTFALIGYLLRRRMGCLTGDGYNRV